MEDPKRTWRATSDACYCDSPEASYLPCPAGRCPNNPHTARKIARALESSTHPWVYSSMNTMHPTRLAELYDTAEQWRREWQRDPRTGVNGHEAATVLLEALAEITRIAGPYLPGPEQRQSAPETPPRQQLFHATVALQLSAEAMAHDPERSEALTAAAKWCEGLYLGGR